MRRLVVSVCCFLLVVLAACSQQEISDPVPFSTLDSGVATELFLSEYVEGSGNNKALELFNGTDTRVDLSEYRVEIYFNGSTEAGRTVELAGQLRSGDVHVLVHASADAELLSKADQTGDGGWFNGDDAIVLWRGGDVVDSVGQLGVDPGYQWGSGVASSQDNTLRRSKGVCLGDTDPNDEFDPALQWNGFSADDFSGFGDHTAECEPGSYPAAPTLKPNQVVPIYMVQGDGPSSPFVGDEVRIEGVVVGDFQEYGSLRGFFVEELEGDGLDETSDGIFVYHYSTDVAVGDLVEVRGTIDEYHGLTELTDVTKVKVIGSETPEATTLSLPLEQGTSWERYEGMLVELRSSRGDLVATEVYHLGRGGVVMLADERVVQYTQTNDADKDGYAAHLESLKRRTILLDDGSLEENPDPIRFSTTGEELTAQHTLRVGDSTPEVTGVVTYSWSGWGGTDAYRIHPTEEIDFLASNPRPQDVPDVGGSLQVGSFNVLNFFNGDGMGGGFPTPRGAYNEFELERQLDKLVAAIVRLDAEVLGLVEIENDAGPNSALADLVAALNAEAGEGTYGYIDTGVIGTDEIKVALIYQPAEVNPTGPHRVLNSTFENDHYTLDPRFDDSKNRPALAQTFCRSGGSHFTVVVNHLKSKGSECSGDPDLGQGQGNCNETRTEAAEALADWADLLAKESGDPDVLITGDLNAYAMEDPIQALEDGGFENLLEQNEYTYVFMGESGTLDHALATSSLADQVTGAEVWSINTEEPSVLDYSAPPYKSDRHVELLYSDSPFRASDHDPVVVGLELTRTR